MEPGELPHYNSTIIFGESREAYNVRTGEYKRSCEFLVRTINDPDGSLHRKAVEEVRSTGSRLGIQMIELQAPHPN
jgi:hypothetical protein